MRATASGLKAIRIGPWEKGIDERSIDRQGACSGARNILLDEIPGAFTKRQGSKSLSTLTSGNSARDGYVFTKSDGTSYLLASDGQKIYYSTDAVSWTLLVSGLTSDGFMSFETAEDKVWMSNGVDAVMSWDGTTLLTFNRTYTSTTNLTTVDGTHIIHAGLTSSDDYWNGMKMVFTAGANVGTVVTVTDYVEATKTLTFTPTVAGIAATDRFVIGLNLPKGRYLRFWNDNLFIGSTTDNTSELRFNRRDDSDTGNYINIDNPRAWPSSRQLNISSSDGDRVWGISPVLRDRILIHKASGIWRLERDPLTLYRIETLSREIGSRFSLSWAEKAGLLYFVGQARDGFVDVYKTDMIDVQLVDKAGGLQNTLRALRQPNTIQASALYTSAANFDTGSKSTSLGTSGNTLTPSGTIPSFVSNSNISTVMPDGSTGYRGLLGIPTWDVRFDGATTPETDPTNPWTSDGHGTYSAAAGEVTYTSPTSDGSAALRRVGVLNPNKNAIMTVRAKTSTLNTAALTFGLFNGAKSTYLTVRYRSSGDAECGVNTANYSVTPVPGFDPTTYHIYTIQLMAAGTYKIWVDGTLWFSGTALDDTTESFVLVSPSYVRVGGANPTLRDNGLGGHVFDFFHYAVDSSLAPDTLSLSGTFVVLFDYTRTPDALRRYYADLTLRGGTVAFESWSASASDFGSGTDPSGYLSYSNGNEPTSQVKRYLRIRVTITAGDYGNSPEIPHLYGGTLWLSPAINIGSNIAAWRTLLASATTPAGTAQTMKVRMATTTASPAEGDWAAFASIAGGDNIGTALSDTTPPSARWLQIKVEQGPSSAGALPTTDSLEAQWNEGSATILPLCGVMRKNRYMFCAAQSSSSANDRVIVYDRNDAPMIYDGWNVNALIHFRGLLIGFSATDAKILSLDVSGLYNDQGAAIDAYLDTNNIDFGALHLRKSLRYSYIHSHRQACTLSVSYKRPGDTDFTGTTSVVIGSTGQDARQAFAVGTVSRFFQRRYRNAVIDENMKIIGETIYATIRGAQPA